MYGLVLLFGYDRQPTARVVLLPFLWPIFYNVRSDRISLCFVDVHRTKWADNQNCSSGRGARRTSVGKQRF